MLSDFSVITASPATKAPYTGQTFQQCNQIGVHTYAPLRLIVMVQI